MIRPLVIDDRQKAAAKKVMDYAEKYHYIVGESADAPGADPRFVLNTLFGYRCVFSYTVVHGQKFRDLSVSVSAKGKYPNEYAFYTIASELFGFTGWDQQTIVPAPKGWMLAKDIDYPAIRVVQLQGTP
jgi:hypothetical protein